MSCKEHADTSNVVVAMSTPFPYNQNQQDEIQ
jgi:hypothetical protein